MAAPSRVARIVAAVAVMAVVFAPTAPSDAQGPLIHAVPTNMPGVYAVTQPPAGFNPLTASAQELAAWGYPPRPPLKAGADALASWSEVVGPTLRRVVPQLVKRAGVRHGPIRRLRVMSRPFGKYAATEAQSDNWSGYALVPASGGQPFYHVSAHWTVPTVKQAPHTCSDGWDYSSQWVGIGGFADAYLLQAGSAANVFCDVGDNIPEYFPWLEWLPNSELVIYKNASAHTLFPFAPGDYLIVTVWATDFSSGVSTMGNLLFKDVTQGWSFSLRFSAASVGGSQVTGQSAEWIVERTDIGGTLATLPDYVADPWWAAAAVDLGAASHWPGKPVGATAYNITMLDDNGANVSFVRLFGTDALWFFPKGSATQ